MTKEKEEPGKELPVPADSRITFARKNDLVKTLKKIDKSVDAAIDFLEEVMLDSNNDVKVRIEAAKFIIDKKQAISAEISKDQLSRTLAESRQILQQASLAKPKSITSDDEDEDDTPRVEFQPNVIVDVNKIKQM